MRRRWAPLFFVFICATSIYAQEGIPTVARTVQLDATPPDAPFKIVKVMLNGAAVEPGVPLEGGDDWFNRLQIVIRNMSRKSIVYAAGQLRFPETGDATAEHLAVMDRISVGRRPEHARSATSLAGELRPVCKLTSTAVKFFYVPPRRLQFPSSTRLITSRPRLRLGSLFRV